MLFESLKPSSDVTAKSTFAVDNEGNDIISCVALFCENEYSGNSFLWKDFRGISGTTFAECQIIEDH